MKVVRKGEERDLAAGEKFKVLEREAQMEQHVMDGTLSAVLLMEDIRPGDLIDTAFSLRFKPDIFGSKYFAMEPLQLPVDVSELMLSLRLRAGQEPGDIRWRTEGEELAPQITRAPDGRAVMTWRKTELTAHEPEANLPEWVLPFSRLELSEFSGWGEVAASVHRAWAGQYEDAPEIDAIAERIMSEAAGDSAKAAVLALQHLQEEYRYLSISGGIRSFVPERASVVIGRRYGDCKDKTLLLVALLRHLGIQADPALVHTEIRRGIAQFMPSPAAFNHAIVCAQLGGKAYWLDPTMRAQRGSLDDCGWSTLGMALVIGEATDGLKEIPLPHADATYLELREEFSIPKAREPVRLKVETDARGWDATRLRSMWEILGRDAMLKALSGGYEELYGKAEAVEFPEIEDVEDGNAMKMRESYTLPHMGRESQDRNRLGYQFHPQVLIARIAGGPRGERNGPFALTYPCHVIQRISVIIEGGAHFEAESKSVDGPGFSFRYRCTPKGGRADLFFEYKTSVPYIPAKDYSAYLSALQKVSHYLNFGIDAPNIAPSPKRGWASGKPAFQPRHAVATASSSTGVENPSRQGYARRRSKRSRSVSTGGGCAIAAVAFLLIKTLLTITTHNAVPPQPLPWPPSTSLFPASENNSTIPLESSSDSIRQSLERNSQYRSEGPLGPVDPAGTTDFKLLLPDSEEQETEKKSPYSIDRRSPEIKLEY
ncbi:MAG: DUF3857 domain-containing protein [Verrucomicrobiales bacterium]